MDGVHQPAVELEVLRRDLDLERHLDGGLPGLEALELCELAALLADLARDAEQDAAALDRPAITPAGARSPRRRDRGGALGGVAARRLGDPLARRALVVLHI